VTTPDPSTEGVRLQKVLAGAGLGSRRACEALIAAGRVEVDGVVVREQGVRVDPARVVLHVDGERVQLDPDKVTLALHKPRGMVSSMHDENGRPDLSQVVNDTRLFHVGRLDADSEGLLLLTNDGDLAHRLTHPSHEVAKTYVVTVQGRVKPAVGAALRHGVDLEDGPAAVDQYRLIDATSKRSLVEVVLHEGRNRIVRRMFESVGHPVIRLVRTQIGPVRLGDLRPGQTRAVQGRELGALMAGVGL
jgi:23S rRNA pseudouridine2605 synthase